jgi:SOS response regulatory protein OraA/RecX
VSSAPIGSKPLVVPPQPTVTTKTAATGGAPAPKQPAAAPTAADARYASSFQASSTSGGASASSAGLTGFPKLAHDVYHSFFPPGTPGEAGKKQELVDLANKLKGEGKTDKEIKYALQDKAISWATGKPVGTSTPEGKGDTSDANIDKMLKSSYRDFFATPITADRERILKELGQKLRGEGKSEREIKDAIINQIMSWKSGKPIGSTTPESKGDTSDANIDRMLKSSYRDFFATPIPADRERTLKELGQRLRGEGKSEREIKDAILNQISAWKSGKPVGSTTPESKGDTSDANIDRMLRSSYRDFFSTALPADRERTLKELGQRLRGEGKSEREIKDAIIDQISAWKAG